MLRRLKFQIHYFRKPPWDTGIFPPELMDFVATHPPGNALDLGCGTGTNVITLAKHGWRVVGIDFIPSAIYQARKKAKKAGIQAQFHVDDVVRYTSPGRLFDLVLDIGCFHSLTEDKRLLYLDNLQTLMAPGGYFLLYIFLKQAETEPGSGITQAELDQIQSRLLLHSEVVGNDRNWRPSAWLTYQYS